MRMAKAVSFAMLGVEDRWRDWLPRADQILDVLTVEVGAVVRPDEMTEQEKADLQVWLRHGRIGTGRGYQAEVARAYQIEAESK